jgi:hypothetical protein
VAGDAGEHVGEVEEYCSPCWWKVVGYWCGDLFFNLELHCVDDEVCSVRGANNVVKLEHVSCRLFFGCLSNVCHHELTNSCRYAKVAEF